MGRPRRSLSPAQCADVERLAARGLGQRRIASLLGVSRRQVRAHTAPDGLGHRDWTDRERQHLREYAGERGPKRLARDLGAMGPGRSPDAVRRQLLRMGLRLEDLRTDLGVGLITELVGRSEPFILRALGRRELHGRQVDGAWRVWPSELRRWILADRSRVLLREVVLWEELAGLLAGEWGVAEERDRRRRRRGLGEAEGP